VKSTPIKSTSPALRVNASETDATPPPSSSKRARVVIRWVATALLLAWLARTADWKTVGPTLADASPAWIAAAAGCYLASQFASVARWRLLVRAGGIAATFSRLLSTYFEGMFVNICLPTSLGGDVLKVLRIGGAHDKRTAATTVVADRASGVVALVVLLALGLLMRFNDRLPSLAAPLIIASCATLGLAALVGGRTALQHFAKSANIIGRTLRAMPLITQAPWPRIVSWAVVVQGLNVAAVAAAAKAVGASISVAGLLIATETASLATALPLSVAGVGIRETTLPMLLAADGVPQSTAVALGLTWSAIVLAIGVVGGIGHIIEQRRAARATADAAIIRSPSTQPRRTTDAPRTKLAA
jgi:uncharacterized membrane protein YbhN (UPF0104 family)